MSEVQTSSEQLKAARDTSDCLQKQLQHHRRHFDQIYVQYHSVEVSDAVLLSLSKDPSRDVEQRRPKIAHTQSTLLLDKVGPGQDQEKTPLGETQRFTHNTSLPQALLAQTRRLWARLVSRNKARRDKHHKRSVYRSHV